MFSAARGAGKTLLMDAKKESVVSELAAGSKPNGLAWDTRRKHLLATDIEDDSARIIDPSSRQVLSAVRLPGRPRWCVHDYSLDLFLANIIDPSGVLKVSAGSMMPLRFLSVSVAGAHGLDILKESGLAFVDCDGKAVVVLNVESGKETAAVQIAGQPDAIWHNPMRNRLYFAIGRPGIIDVIDTLELVVDEELETEEGCSHHCIRSSQTATSCFFLEAADHQRMRRGET